MISDLCSLHLAVSVGIEITLNIFGFKNSNLTSQVIFADKPNLFSSDLSLDIGILTKRNEQYR